MTYKEAALKMCDVFLDMPSGCDGCPLATENYDDDGNMICQLNEVDEAAWNKIVQKVDVMEKNLNLIIDIAIDYDGYRTVTGLMALIDELADLAAMALRGETLQDMTYEDLIAAEMESERTDNG